MALVVFLALAVSPLPVPTISASVDARINKTGLPKIPSAQPLPLSSSRKSILEIRGGRPQEQQEVKKLLAAFLQDAESYQKAVLLPVIVEFVGRFGNGIVGQCFFGTNLIQIDSEFWQRGSALSHEVLLYHELGHCLLRREHRDELDRQGFPVSVMAPVLVDEALWEKRRAFYKTELFSQAASAPVHLGLMPEPEICLSEPGC